MASNPKQGGDLFDMASQPDKVAIPGDAGKMNTIPSKPRPDQIASNADPNDLGSSELDGATTNAGDIPRGPRDQAPQEILTGTGDALPSTVDSKRLHPAPGGDAGDPLSKGHPRYEKHHVQKGGDQDIGAEAGPYVNKDVPGLEDKSLDAATDAVERKA